MKFKADKAALTAGINTVIRSVPTRCTISIFECILIKADDRGLTITANDLETVIETRVDADVMADGLIAVDAKLFNEIIRKMPDRDITFTSDEKFNVKLRAGKSSFSIAGRDGNEFSGIPDVDDTNNAITIPQGFLRDIIQSTIFATNPSDSNRMMGSEYFEVKDGVFSVTALDGHRIARRRAKTTVSNPVKAIIPCKALSDISRLLSSDDDTIDISVSNNHAVFEFGETIMVARLVGGTYFDTDRMTSYDSFITVTADRNHLISVMERALLFTKEGNTKPVIWDITDNEIQFSIRSNVGDMNETMDVEKNGEDLSIGFNPKFMLDALRAIPDDVVTLHMISGKAPCFIRDEDDTYLYLVLPVTFAR